jgi:hypothetical protein
VSILLRNDRVYEEETSRETADREDEDNSESESEVMTDVELSGREIQTRLEHISDVVTKLLNLARVIRVSGVRSRTTKAATYVYYDEDGINQTAIFEDTYLPIVLRYRYQVPETLLARLCKVISLRRRLFLYQHKHQKRLAYHGGALGDSDHPNPPTVGLLPHTQLASTSKLKTSPSKEFTSAIQPGHARSGITAPTRATTYRANALKRTAPSTLVASTAKLVMGNMDFPPQPLAMNRSTHIQCLYCCLLVEVRKLSPAAWRKHVVHDLQPFACIEPTCPDPYVILETWGDWVEHHKWTHAMEWWCEGLEEDHPPTRFTIPEAYSSHLLSDHMSTLSLRDVSKQVTTGGGPSQEPFTCCPFCDFQPSGAGSALTCDGLDKLAMARMSQDRLQRHIFDHLLSMFMLALPDRDDIEDTKIEEESALIRSSAAAHEQSKSSKHSSMSRQGVVISEPFEDTSVGTAQFQHLQEEQRRRLLIGGDGEALAHELAKYMDRDTDGKAKCTIQGCRETFENESSWRFHIEDTHKVWLNGLKNSVTPSASLAISWDEVWDCPQLAGSIRESYAGPVEDIVIQQMARSREAAGEPQEEVSTIKCICGYADDDGETVNCKKCDTRQHLECYYPRIKVPEKHLCTGCFSRDADAQKATERQKEFREDTTPRPSRSFYKCHDCRKRKRKVGNTMI